MIKNLQNLSVAFSGSGWMAAYHFGAVSALADIGFRCRNQEFEARLSKDNVPTRNVTAVGTSGGAIAAAVLCTNGDSREIMKNMGELSRRPDFKKNMAPMLKDLMLERLPPNAVDLCNERLYVTVSQLSPRKLLVVRNFSSREDIADAVVSSCYIPYYTGTKPTTMFRGRQAVDGGLFGGLMPHIGELRISPYPRRIFRRKPVICLDNLWEDSDHYLKRSSETEAAARLLLGTGLHRPPLFKLLRWSLVPPHSDVLNAVYEIARASTFRYFELQNQNQNQPQHQHHHSLQHK